MALWTLVRSPLLGRRPQDDDDASLVRRACAEDGAAFRQIFERYGPAVRRLLGDLLGDASAADEALQETFVRAYDRLGGIQRPEKLLPWLLGIARNLTLELRRRESRRAEEPLPEEDPGSSAPWLRAPQTPEDAMLSREIEALVRDTVAGLSEGRRTALLLRVDHGLAYDEIARILGWSLAKVKVEIFRGRSELRARLARHGQEGEP